MSWLQLHDGVTGFPRSTGSRPRAPWVVSHDGDDGGAKWRGAQIHGIAGDNITLRLHLEPFRVGTRIVDRSLFTAAGMGVTLGDPVCCEVEGSAADNYVVVGVHSTVFAGLVGPGADQTGSVTRGEFHPGAINGVAGSGVHFFQDGSDAVV